jgi:hypothetical protein
VEDSELIEAARKHLTDWHARHGDYEEASHHDPEVVKV